MMFDPMYFLFIAAGPAAVAVGQLQDPLGVQQILQGADRDRPDRRPGGAAAAAERRHQRRRDRAPPRHAVRPLQPGDQEAGAVGAGLRPAVGGRDRCRLPRGRSRHPARPEATRRCGCARSWCRPPTSARALGYIVMIAGLMLHALMKVVLIGAVHVLGGAALPARHPAGRVRRLGAGQAARVRQRHRPATRARRAWTKVLNAAALTYVAAAVSTLDDAALLPDARGPPRRAPGLTRPRSCQTPSRGYGPPPSSGAGRARSAARLDPGGRGRA